MEKSEKNNQALPEEELDSFGKLLLQLIDEKVIPSKFSTYSKDVVKLIASLYKNSEIENSILDSAFKVSLNLSDSGEILFISKNCKEQLGYDADELIGKKFIDFIPGIETERTSGILIKLFKEKCIYSEALILRTKADNLVSMDFNAEVIETEKGLIGQGRLQDLNERLKAEQYIRTSESVFKNVWNKSSEGMLLTDEDGYVFMCNEAYAKMFDLSRAEIEGQLFSSVYSDDTSRIILNNYLIRFKTTHF